eukprot:763183-Hanusia_phi.AAC.1
MGWDGTGGEGGSSTRRCMLDFWDGREEFLSRRVVFSSFRVERGLRSEVSERPVGGVCLVDAGRSRRL